ncbi:DUF6929 family protein [Flavobacterium sp.]|uniref:DUF6929 family protein n=1 Tax=Flavobacterium sp. TaxID=239 RepID=UPI00286B89ED|nr:hypothetical protein [Flavobacterium sp.]
MQNFTLDTFCQISGIGAASGLIFNYDKLFIISDNSTFLYQYELLDQKLTKIKLLENSQDNILKKNKPDFESITLKDNKLYLFGSGSTSKREKRLSYNRETKEIKEKSLEKIYQKLKTTTAISDEELNIEGAFYSNQKWFFFQRGNGSESKNGVFTVDAQKNATFISIRLPKIDTIEATFTDAILVEDKIYFLAAAENTTSTYDDGEILGSIIGQLNITTMEVNFTQIISTKHKFEGLTLYKKTQDKIEFLLCEDNDTQVLETIIYKLTLNTNH